MYRPPPAGDQECVNANGTDKGGLCDGYHNSAAPWLSTALPHIFTNHLAATSTAEAGPRIASDGIADSAIGDERHRPQDLNCSPANDFLTSKVSALRTRVTNRPMTQDVNGNETPHHASLQIASPRLSSAPVSATATTAALAACGFGRVPIPDSSLCPTAQTSSALASEVAYCLTSAGTILFNKHLLSSYQYPAPNALLCFQFLVAVLLLQVLRGLHVIHVEPLRWELICKWAPVNLIFVAMNVTGLYALRTIGAGMFTVLKNLSNLMTIAGDYYFFGNSYSVQVWACLALIMVSAALGGVSDLHFSANGYAWQALNCTFTAAYSLTLGGVIRRIAVSPPELPAPPVEKQRLLGAGDADGGEGGRRSVPSVQPFSELSMVYYNNVLSVPSLLVLSVCSGEVASVRSFARYREVEFQVVAAVGALLGFGVSLASMWCMNRTSPTIFSMTGSLNKVLVAVVGLTYFAEPTTPLNLASIVVGILAGMLFVCAKSKKIPHQKPSSSTGGALGGSVSMLVGRAASLPMERRSAGGSDSRSSSLA